MLAARASACAVERWLGRALASSLPFALLACGSASPSSSEDVPAELRALELPVSAAVPPDTSNRFAEVSSAAAFGQRLFFEPGFSGQLLDGDNDGGSNALGRRGDTGKVACAGCHLPASGFSDSRSLRRQISLAAGWGKRRAPSLLDVGQSKLLTWDGRRDALYNQIFGVIESPLEMNSSRLYAAEQTFALHRAEYEALFGPMPPLDDATRFPRLGPLLTGCSQLDQSMRVCKGEEHGVPGDGAEFDHLAPADQDAVTQVVVNLGKAIGAYERLLSCGSSRFDAWLRGGDPLTPSEQRGAALFVGKAKCSSCHSGPYLSDEKFHNVGLKPAVVATVFLDDGDVGAASGVPAMAADPLNVRGKFSDGDDGRGAVAVEPALEGAFRTPRLRCVAQRPSFMHTGQFLNLDDVVAFFNRGGDSAGYPGKSELTPLALSAEERSDLIAFMGALTGPGPAAELTQAP